MELLNKISYGLYLIAATDGDKKNACIINTLMQQTSTPQRVSVTVSKQNLTHDMIEKSGKCSVLVLDTEFEVFKDFGMRSGKTVDKFEGRKVLTAENGADVPDVGGIGFFELQTVDTNDIGTHTVFLCDITVKHELNDGEPLTYAYYHKHIKPRSATAAKTYVCSICGYMHEGDLPNGFICPICKHGTEVFELQQPEPTPLDALKTVSKTVKEKLVKHGREAATTLKAQGKELKEFSKEAATQLKAESKELAQQSKELVDRLTKN